MNTLTPRTDKAVQESNGQWSFAMRNLCIQMECEIAALTKELAEAREQLEDFEVEATNAINDIVRVKYQRDTLANLLEECLDDSEELIAERDWWKDEPRCNYQLEHARLADRVERVRKALAAVKGGNDE